MSGGSGAPTQSASLQDPAPPGGHTPPGGVCALDFDIEHKTPAFSERRGWGAGGHPQLGPVRGRGLDLSWPQVQDRPRGRIGVAAPLPPTEQKRSSSPVDARARDAQNGGPQGRILGEPRPMAVGERPSAHPWRRIRPLPDRRKAGGSRSIKNVPRRFRAAHGLVMLWGACPGASSRVSAANGA